MIADPHSKPIHYGRTHQVTSAPSSTTRRRSSPPPRHVVVHGTLMLVGASLGTFVGLNTLVGAHQWLGPSSNLIDYLPALVVLLGGILMTIVKSQMDSVRSTVFLKKKNGEQESVRIRRRPEVIRTVCFRGLGLLAAGVLMLTIINLGIQHYRETLGLAHTSASILPPMGSDVLLVVYAIAAAALTLSACEATLRLTQKEGVTNQALSLFIPAILSLGFSIHLVHGLLT